MHVPYKEQLTQKQKTVEKLLGRYGKVQPVIGMEDPRYYRNKVHHAFSYSRKTGPIHGSYQEDSHKVVMVKDCLLEDQISQKIIDTVCSLLPSFKITVYNEDTGFGLLRHVLVRRGFTTGEIMVVLVAASPVFPSKNNFVKALRKIYPEITTVVLNINSKRTSMVLGERNITLYGPGFITDILCRKRFRISPSSFYQVNPVQTEKLYTEAIRMAGLTSADTVLDAYCGIGTIGMAASGYCKEVCGVELNPEAVRDARTNAKINGVKNIRFIAGDAGEFMEQQAAGRDPERCRFHGSAQSRQRRTIPAFPDAHGSGQSSLYLLQSGNTGKRSAYTDKRKIYGTEDPTRGHVPILRSR